MTTTQRYEALTVSIRQLTEGMADARDRCLAASEAGDHRAASEAGAKYFRLAERREYLQGQLEQVQELLAIRKSALAEIPGMTEGDARTDRINDVLYVNRQLETIAARAGLSPAELVARAEAITEVESN